ncbi:glycoside hydrolase family 3 N-terminal domain-containing protein [Mycobacterium sp. OTB74]|jgi:beta-N-acetylhexosaminidase|uniref:glycoside hydrolase family 3 N-terminal domain-containing protein n=1 Tax=Mycobacterium sp. OTB74 TaxID=1853452 RepID=UPI0024752A55|nr:glycoside hydrolase family 3 N-terminal domain-containing protein [Mycobacterium sp. OTB74]MDH6243380.1 beta-N-acetylhexosaminidase [Mycobacterium sp. OTB74]
MFLPRALGVLTLVSGLLAGCSQSTNHPAAPTSPSGQAATTKQMAPPSAPPCDPQALIGKLTLRQELAQLLMVGVKDSADARAVVANQEVGGIFIGSWTDLSIFDDGTLPALQAEGALPLAVSVDEEGGRVSRLKKRIGTQDSPRVLSQTQTPEQVHDIARDRGVKMKSMGITIDLAPVTDVTDEPDDAVIGDRSFGSTPDQVTKFAGAYAQGLRDAGLLPVLKHFPGHGHGSGDSHTAGVVTTPPLDELKTNDMVPYRTLATQAPVAVMVGHLEVPGLTGDDPASLSKPAYDLLRHGWDGGPPFSGVIFTDDLSSMAAINERYGVAAAVLKALQAGADIALWVTTDEVPAVLDGLEKAVNADELDRGQVDRSFVRVATMKGPSTKCVR